MLAPIAIALVVRIQTRVNTTFYQHLVNIKELKIPILQAPIELTVELAVAVCEAGGMGSSRVRGKILKTQQNSWTGSYKKRVTRFL
ncbi:MAG: NAD(P)H-dependent flavin oxidoreductase YrpB (nitropropane dioxygenase family) [Parasphingorhabdus sp.]